MIFKISFNVTDGRMFPGLGFRSVNCHLVSFVSGNFIIRIILKLRVQLTG